MYRLFTLTKFNSRSCSFAADVAITASAVKKSSNFPTKEIEREIRKRPELQKYSKDKWQNVFDTLTNQGFRPHNFMTIIEKRPQLLNCSTDKLVESMECLRTTQFGDTNLIELIEEYPEMLEYTDANRLRKRLAFLKSYVNTEKNIFRLFMSSPNVLTDDETTIHEKFEYITRVMKVSEAEAARSKALSHSLDVIKCRHVFLSRLGMFEPYVKPKKQTDDTLKKNKNPKMSDIYDTSDEKFALNTCGVTIEEYETFIQLYKREKNRDEDWED